MRTAITVSLVEEARGGPFVFWDGLEDACQQASRLGFDAIELFAPGPDTVPPEELKNLLDQYSLQLAAVGTGAGWVIHKLSLTDPNPDQRAQAADFIQSMIDYGAPFGAPAIIGSMQGRYGGEVDQATALGWLSEALNQLGTHAAAAGVPLIYEPLNRYETNLVNHQAAGARLLDELSTDNVRLLADLFHMQIEESDLADAIRAGGRWIGHVHYVDSNRQAAGRGHMQYAPIVDALREIDYVGYLSAEAFPIPDSTAAAEQTINAIREHLS